MVVTLVLGWAIPAIGFRILYDSVIPEVVLFLLSGFVIGRSNKAPGAALGLMAFIAGMTVAQAVRPPPAPAAHVAQYGPPARPSLGGFLLIAMFPTAGTLMGMLVRSPGIFAMGCRCSM